MPSKDDPWEESEANDCLPKRLPYVGDFRENFEWSIGMNKVNASGDEIYFKLANETESHYAVSVINADTAEIICHRLQTLIHHIRGIIPPEVSADIPQAIKDVDDMLKEHGS
jgi:hypothetical protein